MRNQSHIRILDALRGFAALYVMIGHARWLLWEGFSTGYQLHPDSYNFIEKTIAVFFLLFRFGREFVILFFLLSGYLIFQSSMRNGMFASLRPYAVRRIRRIYPPLVVALLVTLAVDTAGMHLFLPIYFGEHPYQLIAANISVNHSPRIFFENLVGLMTYAAPAYGTNSPLWSLGLEIWFYLIFGFLGFMLRSSGRVLSAAVLLGLLGLYLNGNEMFLPYSIVMSGFGIWCLGALLAFGIQRNQSSKAAGLFFCCLGFGLPGYLVFKASAPFPAVLFALERIGDWISGLGFMGIVGYFLLWPWEKSMFRYPISFLEKAAPFSYTLYLVHFPLLVFYSGVLMNMSPEHALPKSQVHIFVGIAVVLFVSWALHFITERPFIRKHSS